MKNRPGRAFRSVFAEIIDGPWQVRLGIYAILSATAMLIVGVLRDEGIESRKDLVSVRGIVAVYRFEQLPRGRRHYALWLVDHTATFRISANLIPHFDEAAFRREIHSGDSLELEIARSTATSFESGDEVRVHGMRSPRSSYIDAEQGVNVSRSRFVYVASALFAIIGFLLLQRYWGRR